MTQIFQEDGSVVPVTVASRTHDGRTGKDRGKKTATMRSRSVWKNWMKKVNQAKKGHFEKAVSPLCACRKCASTKARHVETGQEIAVDIFEAGERVDVVGTSKEGHPGRNQTAQLFTRP